MNLILFKRIFETRKNLKKYTLPHTKIAFMALADAVLPNTHDLEEKDKNIQYFGALDLCSDKYLIWSLNHFISFFILTKRFHVYLSNATAELLNTAAKELINVKGNKDSLNAFRLKKGHAFAALSPNDRFRALMLLQQLKIDFKNLPVPFLKNPGFVLSITISITLLTTIGYYSEWSGYGSTRMKSPEKRKLEHFPVSWQQVGYPGPSKGYHAFKGYLIEKFEG
jgi:hypothetical protein